MTEPTFCSLEQAARSLNERLGRFGTVFFAVDPNLLQTADDRLISRLKCRVIPLEIPVGEKAKSTTAYVDLVKSLAANNANADSILVAMGGGATTDLCGFVAATYMRGMQLILIPTTLMGMVDASIGGKNSINVAGIKNLVGAIKQPEAIYTDVSMLKTIGIEAFWDGLAEIAKIGAVADRNLFFQAAEMTAIYRSQSWLLLESFIKKAVKLKLDIAENGNRDFLNFGHTVGHALELQSAFSHGEAVWLGMRIEAAIANRLRVLPTREFDEMEELLVQFSRGYSLPLSDQKLEAMKLDKKNREGLIRFALPEKIGSAKIVDVGEGKLRRILDLIEKGQKNEAVISGEISEPR